MTIDKIIQKIEAETEAEAKEILTNAQNTAKEIKKEASKELAEKLDHIKDQGEKRVTIMRNIHLSEARRMTRRSILGAKEELIQKSFEEAKNKLRSLTGEQYRQVLMKLVKESLPLVGAKAVAKVTREEDKAILRTVPNITVKPELASGLGGLIIESADGKIVVDNTFDAILERQIEEIRTEVANLLFPDVEK
jgi:V/A-type H+-transporting ATPase subunit E